MTKNVTTRRDDRKACGPCGRKFGMEINFEHFSIIPKLRNSIPYEKFFFYSTCRTSSCHQDVAWCWCWEYGRVEWVFRVCKATISRVQNRLQAGGTIGRKVGSGSIQHLSRGCDRCIAQSCRDGPANGGSASSAKIRDHIEEEIGEVVSRRTVCRALHRQGLAAKRRRPGLTLMELIPKAIGNRKRDCAWGCARGINTTWENLQIEKHKSVRWAEQTPSWFVLFDLQIFYNTTTKLAWEVWCSLHQWNKEKTEMRRKW